MIPRFVSGRPGPLFCVLGALAAIGAPAAYAQEPRAEYRMSLSDVYGAYQHIVARRAACDSAFPALRPATGQAYKSWHARHQKLIGELDQRFNMMIRGASKDEKDFARNVGKYEGGLLRQREEAKQALLQLPRGELEAECKALPEFLRGADSDLEKEFAEQLAVVRKRPLVR